LRQAGSIFSCDPVEIYFACKSWDPKDKAMFQGWDDFYLMIGPAAAGLIGLLFVVVTLTAGRERSQVLRGTSLYMTPTALAFAIVMTVSAVAMAPRVPVWTTASIIGLCALAGLVCAVRACVGIGLAPAGLEAPHWSDVWFYGAAPTGVHLALAAAAVAVWARADCAAHALAGVLLVLLLLGMRNAWDLVTWMAPGMPNDAGKT
jgi:hypothetical protein